MYGAYYPGYAYYGMSGGYVFTTFLAISDADHTHTVEVISLTQAHTLALADALHAHVVDNVGLALHIALSVEDALHLHTAESLSTINILFREKPNAPLLKLSLPIVESKNPKPSQKTSPTPIRLAVNKEEIMTAIKTQKSTANIKVEQIGVGVSSDKVEPRNVTKGVILKDVIGTKKPIVVSTDDKVTIKD